MDIPIVFGSGHSYPAIGDLLFVNFTSPLEPAPTKDPAL